MSVTSSDVCAALKLRYPRQSHALMFEVAPRTGGGTRYADAVVVGLWASHGHMIEGIEVKVSRSDFLNEMKQPEKSAPVYQYCDRWWLACPKDMVKVDELPPTWGLLELLDNGTLREKKKAPKLEPKPVILPFFAAMTRRIAGMDEDMAQRAVDARVKAALDYDEQRITREVEMRTKTIREQYEATLALTAQVEERFGIKLQSWDYQQDKFLAAFKFAFENLGNYSGLDQLRKQLVAAVKSIEQCGLVKEE